MEVRKRTIFQAICCGDFPANIALTSALYSICYVPPSGIGSCCMAIDLIMDSLFSHGHWTLHQPGKDWQSGAFWSRSSLNWSLKGYSFIRFLTVWRGSSGVEEVTRDSAGWKANLFTVESHVPSGIVLVYVDQLRCACGKLLRLAP